MRSLILLSILLGAATACNQPLTPDMTGSGGTGAGPGAGAGGFRTGSGGSGGSNLTAACNTLVAAYQNAFTAAETCQVGASGQCQQVVTESLSGCSCPTYVTDTSELSAIQEAWLMAGCVVPGPVCGLLCPAALNSTCVSTDGGSAGFCSYVPGTGGSGGSGGTGGGATGGSGGSLVDGGLSDCGSLVSAYASALVAAESCTAGAADQCAAEVPTSLSVCSAGCTEFVTDRSVLDAIREKWDAAGCGNVAVACPLFACETATTGSCVPSDGGGSVCSTGYGKILAN